MIELNLVHVMCTFNQRALHTHVILPYFEKYHHSAVEVIMVGALQVKLTLQGGETDPKTKQATEKLNHIVCKRRNQMKFKYADKCTVKKEITQKNTL